MNWKDLTKLDKIVLSLVIPLGFLIIPVALYIRNTFGWPAVALIGIVFLSGATICNNKKLGTIATLILLLIGLFMIGSMDLSSDSKSNFPQYYRLFEYWNI